MNRLTLDTRVVASTDQVSSELDGEIVLLNHRRGLYYGLDSGVGALVWRTVQAPVRISGIVRAVTERYEVDEARCTADVIGLLAGLEEAGLLQVLPGEG